jgi:hypothetical protein
MAKSHEIFDRDAVHRAFPATFDVVNLAIDRTLDEHHVLVDGANLDFAAGPVLDKASQSPVQTNAHVKISSSDRTTESGRKVATKVVSNWYRLVAIRIEEKAGGCEVTASVLEEKNGNTARSAALLDRIGETLGKVGTPGGASNVERVKDVFDAAPASGGSAREAPRP